MILNEQLETEQSLLVPKARAALARYGHQIVIGNDLHKRKYEVVFVERKNGSRSNITREPEPGSSANGGASTPPLEAAAAAAGEEFKETWLKLEQVSERSTGAGEIEIESLIVERLVERHTKWIEAGQEG